MLFITYRHMDTKVEREEKKSYLVLAVEKLIIHKNVAVCTPREKDRKNNCIQIYCLWAAAPITLLCREVG